MIKADITMKDGTVLNQVMLFKGKNLGDTQINTKEEAESYLKISSEYRAVYFGGKYVQGVLIPEQVVAYELCEDKDDFAERVERFVEKENEYYDINDTANFIVDNREKLLELLR